MQRPPPRILRPMLYAPRRHTVRRDSIDDDRESDDIWWSILLDLANADESVLSLPNIRYGSPDQFGRIVISGLKIGSGVYEMIISVKRILYKHSDATHIRIHQFQITNHLYHSILAHDDGDIRVAVFLHFLDLYSPCLITLIDQALQGLSDHIVDPQNCSFDIGHSMRLVDYGLVYHDRVPTSVKQIVFYLVFYHQWPSDWTELIRSGIRNETKYHNSDPICLHRPQELVYSPHVSPMSTCMQEANVRISMLYGMDSRSAIKFQFGHHSVYWDESRVLSLQEHGESLLYLLDQSSARRNKQIQKVLSVSLPVLDLQALCIAYF